MPTLRILAALCTVVLIAVVCAPGTARPQQSDLSITVQGPSGASAPSIAGTAFHMQLAAQGGTAPFTWHVMSGELPPGVKLHPHKGTVSGVPTTEGEYHVVVGVTDSGYPQLHAQREVVIKIIAGVTIDWKQAPQVQGNTLSGSVIVGNQTAHDFTLTVLIVAVNSHGRATALGYQHFTLPAQVTSQVIPFTGTPGMGSYIVHADAVAQSHHHTYRSRKQTADPLNISQL